MKLILRMITLMAALLIVSESLYAETRDTVKGVADARTLDMSSGERVQLLGVELSDKQSEAAIGYLERSFVGRDVVIERDETYSAHRLQDPGHDLQAYVYLPTRIPDTIDVGHDEWYAHVPKAGFYRIFVNGSLIKQGYSAVERKSEYSLKNDLILLEEEARANKRGLWGSSRFESDGSIVS